MKRTSGGDMEKGVYDTDNDAVVDRAEGVRSVDDFPAEPSIGDMVVKESKMYIRISG